MIKQSSSFFILLFCILFYLQKLVNGEGMLYPTRPVRNAILDFNSKSLLTLYFRVSTALVANNYLRIQLPDYGKTGYELKPTNCLLKYHGDSTFTTSECGVMSTSVMYVKLSKPVVNTDDSENILQIELNTLNPKNNISQSLRVSTISSIQDSIFFQYDENHNFGQIPFTDTNNNVFQAKIISYGTDATRNIPGLSNSIKIQIEINKSFGLDQNMSRIKLIASAPWVFDPATIVTCFDDSRFSLVSGDRQNLYKAPQLVLDPVVASQPIPLVKTQVETPNQLSIVFNQGFKEGSAFIIQVDNLINPSITATGALKIFSLPVNSNESVESNYSLLQLETFQTPISVQLLPSLPFAPLTSPVNFYKNTKQYVSVKIDINSKTIKAGYPIVLEFTPNTQIIKGSEYLDPAMQDINGGLIRNVQYQSNNKMIIYNLKQMVGTVANPTITISTRVLLSKTDAQFYVKVYIYTDMTLSNPQFSGMSDKITLKTNYNSVITALQDTTYATSGFVKIKPSSNDLSFTIQVPANDLTTNLKLTLYASTKLTQESAIVCKIGGVTFACTYSTLGGQTQIDLTPGSFTSAAKTIVISNVKFSSASNHEDSTYELFFRMIKDSTNPSSTYNDFMLPLTVIQQVTSNIDAQFINDLNQSASSTKDYSFPSFLDVFDTADTFAVLNPRPTATEKYYIAVYSQQGFESIAKIPEIGQQFYCGSSLSGISCYYKEKDSTTTLSATQFKEWAKIIFFLPSVTKVGYHMIIPYLFDQSINYNYQIEGGYYDTTTYTYRVLFTNTIKIYSPSTSLISVTNKCPGTSITLSGNAGAKKSNVQIQLARDNAGFVAGVGGAAILVTDWEFWYDNSSKYTNAVSIIGSGVLDPVSVKYIDQTGANRFAVVFPLDKINGDPLGSSTPTSVYIDNVVLPFSYDLPNLLFIIAQSNGKLNCFKQYFNSGRNQFYKSTPYSLLMTCDSQADGVQNTQCTIKFKPTQDIQRYAILKVQFSGMQVNTNECTLIQKNLISSTSIKISQECSVSTDSHILTVKLKDNLIYSNNQNTYIYELSFYGVSIDSAQTTQTKSFTFEIRDLSGNTAIEQQSINVSTSTYSSIFIQVSQLIYKYLNPYVFSQLKIQFSTPRELLPNENVVISLGSDLSDVNANTDRLTVYLYKKDNTNPSNPVYVTVQMAVTFSQNKMRVLLTDRTQFVAGDYMMIIDGILTPASNTNDLIKINFIRNYDDGLVLTSNSVKFPTLLGKSNSDITLTQSNFLMEGSLSEFLFNVTMKNSQIVSTSKMFIYFPIYYPPSISNFPDYIYCRMNNIQIPCKYNNSPFRLELSESPLFIQPGQQFNLLVYGPVAPQYTLRNNPQYVNETIFFAVDTGTDGSFSEFIHLTPPPVIQIPTDFPYMRLIKVNSADTNTRALSTHTFLLETEVALPSEYGFQVVFPTEYKFLKITSSLQCMVSYYDSNSKLVDTTFKTCDVKGLSVEGTIPITIQANSRFTITIQNVPTPPTAGFVDLSRTIIAVFPADRTTYLTQTNYLTNQMGTIQFVEQTNFVSINAGKEIQVTKGTYSPNIIIETADKNKFVANMVIDVSAKGFTFIPASMNIYLGDRQTSFRVGADKNLLEKQYTVDITKKEFGFKSIYQIANNLIVFVISQPIQIVTPVSINVPYNGCSLPYKIVLSSTPFDDVNISIQYDYTQLPEGYLIVDIELSSYTLYFDSQTNYRYLSLCSTKNFPKTITSFTATLSLGGSNIESFQLVNPNLTVNMVQNDDKIVPYLITTVKNTYRTSVDFNVNYNVDGTVYWQVFVDGTSNTLSLSKIKEYLKTQNTIIQQPTTLEQQFFGKKTDERVGLNVFRTTDTNNFFTINSLIPQTKYSLCTYFENELGVSTDIKCIKFMTSNWQIFTKVNISFKIKMFGDDMNDLLCFFVRNTQTRIKNVINADGNSCSLQSVTLPYYFQFKGKSASNSKTQTNLYLIPDADLENDSSIASLAAMYDSTTKKILDTVLTTASTTYNINFINQSNFKLTFTYDDAVNSQNDFIMPTISNIKFQPKSYNFNTTIEIQDISLTHDGQVYFIAERIAKVLFDNIKGEQFDAPITEMEDPTPENIINCKNTLGYKADVCARAIYNNNNQITLVLDDLVPDTKYAIYYVVANHFPITPIYDSKIQKIEIITLPFGAGNFSSIMSVFSSLIALFLIFLI